MVGVFGIQKIVPVTPDTRRWSAEILVMGGIGVTVLARKGGVLAGQRKSRRLVLLNHVRDFPRCDTVTSEAVGSEFCFVHVGMAG